MKIKGDFITNSSSTNYVVEESFQGKLKETIEENFAILVKKIFDYMTKLYVNPAQPDSEKFEMLHLDITFEKDKFTFEAEETEEYLEIQRPGDVWFYGLKTVIEYYGKHLNINFYYMASQEAKDIDDAIKLIVRQIFQDVFEVEDVSVRHKREIIECRGDGWDGGDPCFGHYGESDICKDEVEIKESITM